MHDDQAGFSLVELLVVIVLLGVVGGVVTTSVVQSMQVSMRATTRIDVLTSVERIQQRMSRQIRFADPVLSATPTSLSFSNRDATRRYTYTYTHDVAARTLSQTVVTFSDLTSTTPASTATTVLATDVDTGGPPVFDYFDRTDAPWTAASPVTAISRIQVTIGRSIQDGPPLTIASSVFLRNSTREAA